VGVVLLLYSWSFRANRSETPPCHRTVAREAFCQTTCRPINCCWPNPLELSRRHGEGKSILRSSGRASGAQPICQQEAVQFLQQVQNWTAHRPSPSSAIKLGFRFFVERKWRLSLGKAFVNLSNYGEPAPISNAVSKLGSAGSWKRAWGCGIVAKSNWPQSVAPLVAGRALVRPSLAAARVLLQEARAI